MRWASPNATSAADGSRGAGLNANYYCNIDLTIRAGSTVALSGGVDVITLDRPHTISWPSHISSRDSAGIGGNLAFRSGELSALSCFPQHLDPGWPSDWPHSYEEIILVKIDGSVVRRLARHRSRSAEYYWAESRAAISRDGRDVVFDSNMDLADTGLNNYSDVYMIKVR
jgi:hypothetical protein